MRVLAWWLFACTGGDPAPNLPSEENAADAVPAGAEGARTSGPGWVIDAFDYKMIRVEPAHFTMGARPEGVDGTTVAHEVTLTRPVLLGATEVSQELWEAIQRRNPSKDATYAGKDDPRFANEPLHLGKDVADCAKWGVDPKFPVTCVRWLEAVELANVISILEDLQPAYRWVDGAPRWDPEASGYRLPTEAEFELASRALRDDPWPGGADAAGVCEVANVATRKTKDKEYAWLTWAPFACDDPHLHVGPVGSRAANPWGFHDLVGNAAEWTWDAYAPQTADPATDPRGPEAGVERTVRGGSWADGPEGAHHAARRGVDPVETNPLIGFRLARNAPVDPAGSPPPGAPPTAPAAIPANDADPRKEP